MPSVEHDACPKVGSAVTQTMQGDMDYDSGSGDSEASVTPLSHPATVDDASADAPRAASASGTSSSSIRSINEASADYGAGGAGHACVMTSQEVNTAGLGEGTSNILVVSSMPACTMPVGETAVSTVVPSLEGGVDIGSARIASAGAAAVSAVVDGTASVWPTPAGNTASGTVAADTVGVSTVLPATAASDKALDARVTVAARPASVGTPTSHLADASTVLAGMAGSSGAANHTQAPADLPNLDEQAAPALSNAEVAPGTGFPLPSPAATTTPGDWYTWPDAELPGICPGKSDQVIRAFLGVWNLHGKQAPPDIGAWVATQPKHHIYVVGTCEGERSIAKSLVFPGKTRWEQQVRDHLGEDYYMIGSQTLSAIHVMVLVHKCLWKYCWDVRTGCVATGFANVIGNKGGTHIGFKLGHTSLLVINAHLAAHRNKMRERTQSLSRILLESPIRYSKVVSGVNKEYDRVFFIGDLNPRLEATRSEVDTWLADGQLAKCLERDQLLPLLRADLGADGISGDTAAGLWPLFEEATIAFPPTYKFDADTDRYDTSKKGRVPSWTDRILWKRSAQIKPLAYGSVQSLWCSDHRPIFGQFEVEIDLRGWEGPVQERNGEGSSVCCVQ